MVLGFKQSGPKDWTFQRVKLHGNLPEAFRARALAAAERIKGWPAMVVKLSRIIARADMHTRPAEVLRKYGQDYKIDVTWNEDRMVFDGAVDKQWNILRLLDEAHTLGPVTGKKWESSTKTEV